MGGGGNDGGNAVVAVGTKTFDTGKLHEPPLRTTTGQDGNEVDRFRDQGAWNGDDGFLDELLEPAQGPDGRTRMDRADAARVTRSPGLEEIERLGAADLPDRDAIGAQTQGRADEVGQGGDAFLGAHGDEVGRGALKLAGVLDEDDTVGGPGDFRKKGVGQRGFAGTGSTGDENVCACRDARVKCLGLYRRHDPGGDIILEGKNRDGGLTDGEGRSDNDGRKKAFEPFPRLWELCRDPRRTAVDFHADMMRDQANDAFAVGWRQAFTRVRQAFGEAVGPEAPVRVQHHLDDSGVFQMTDDHPPERCAEHPRTACQAFRILM